MHRIAIGSILTECNQLGGMPIDITWFERLDLHAHVTADMVRYADALLAWETYPHRDAFTTGVRGARLLLGTLGGRCRPAMAMAKAIFVLDTPGPTPPTLRHVRYKHLARPYFPLDEEIPGLTPTILR